MRATVYTYIITTHPPPSHIWNTKKHSTRYSVCSWSEYIPNKNKPFSIVNTDNKTGQHWLKRLVHIQKSEKLYMCMIVLLVI